MYQSEKEHNKKIILNYLKESGALYKMGNVFHAQKAFMVSSVLQWVLRKVDSGEYGSGDVSFYLDSMNDFIDNKIRIYWNEEGNLVIGA
tara:strand:+ start:222 stop:488 length:267 start_codon:yes stop_codon:yes gene_type:complete